MAKKTVNLDAWLTKAEATAITGLSMRALERLIEDGTIAREYRKQPGRRSIAVLHPQDVEQLRREATPINPQIMPTLNSHEENGVPALRNDPVSHAMASFLLSPCPTLPSSRTFPHAARG